MDTTQIIADALLDIGAVKVKTDPPFTWTSGIKSPIYCDNRKLISHPVQRQLVVKAFAELIKNLPDMPDFVGGTATAAIPWAAFIAQELGLPMIYIRPEKKEHGAGKQVEGDLPMGKKVLIIEDLISTGGSSVKAAQAVQQESQGIVTDVFAIMTYELEEAKNQFASSGIKLTTLTDFSHVITRAMSRGEITKEQWEKVIEFKSDPRTWSERVGIK